MSLVFSFLLHAFLVAAGFWLGIDQPSAHIDLNRKIYRVDLVSLSDFQGNSGSKVLQTKAKSDLASKIAPAKPDLKAVPIKKNKVDEPPKKTAPQPKKAVKPKTVAKPKPKPKPKKAAKKISSQKKGKKPPARPKKDKKKIEPQPSPQDILAKALGSARKQAKKKQDSENTVAGEIARLKASRLPKNGGRAESAGQGSGAGQAGAGALQVYASLAEQLIRENWRFPMLAAQDLTATLEVGIDGTGKIVSSRLVQGSGRSDFDSSILKAVDETRQLPAPPNAQVRKLVITFNLSELG